MTESSDDQADPLVKGRFKPGQSGNPGGRSKVQQEIKALLEEAAPHAAQRIIDLIQCEDPKVAAQASNSILDRVLGKARESVEVSGDGLSDLLRALVVARPPPKEEK